MKTTTQQEIELIQRTLKHRPDVQKWLVDIIVPVLYRGTGSYNEMIRESIAEDIIKEIIES